MRRALAVASALLFLSTALPLAAQDPVAEAEALIEAGEAERALATLERWLRKNPKDAAAHLARSTALFITGESQEAIAELDRALELDPGLRQGWLNRGALALAQQDYPEALAAFERAERIDPAADDNAINIGAVLLLQGDLPAATARFRRYLELNPDSAAAYYLVASNYAMTGFVQPAVQTLEYAIRIDERIRRQARVDPNFSDVARDERFRKMLETDGYQPPAGALTASRDFDGALTGANSRILRAVINALETTGEPFDRQIEVGQEWALIWAERFRLKVLRLDLATSRLEMTAAPGTIPEAAWQVGSERFFRAVTLELLKIAKSGPDPPGAAQDEP